MRYFIYKNEQVLGPFSPQEMEEAEDLRPETLVCAEDVSGRLEGDWKSLEEVSELSGVKTGRLVDLTPPEGEESGIMERLELETWGSLRSDEPPERLVSELFQESRIQELSQAQGQVRELTAQIKALEVRLAELQAERANVQAAPAPSPQAPAAETPKPRKEIKLKAPKTFRVLQKSPSAESKVEAELPPLTTPPLMPEAVGKGSEIFPKVPGDMESPGDRPAAAGQPTEAPKPKKEIKLEAPKTFRVVQKPPAVESRIETKPAPEAVAPAVEPVQPIEPPHLGDVPVSPPITINILAPTPEVSQQPAAAPPVTSMFAPEETREAFPSTAPPLTVSVSALDRPIEISPGQPMGPNIFSEGSQDRPAPAGRPPSLPEPQEVLARLAKPSPEPSAPPVRAPRRRFFLFLLAGLSLLAGFLFWLFLRNSRDLKLMASMGADQKPLGEQAPAERPSPAPAPTPDSAAKSTEVAVAGPAPRDLGGEALKLVKEYPLDGDRGSVGQWLQYSFTANPGEANKEEWTAGAVESSVYLVQYRVLPGARGKLKEPITYLFEADLARRTVKASNPAARELMAGAAAPAAKAAKAGRVSDPTRFQRGPSTVPRPRHRPARARKPRAAARKGGAPQLPLPSDMDLLPPSEDGAPAEKDVEPVL